MIRHIVLFELKPDIGPSERGELFGKIRNLAAIPAVLRIDVVTLLEPSDPNYRSHMSSEFGCALLADFEDEAGLYAYQKDPAHVDVAQEIRKRVSAIKVLDFVTGV